MSQDSHDLPKTYEAKETETKWSRFWEEHEFFKADPFSKKPPYTIVMPPPNVTGALHMGHALVSTLQDILIRWKRMLGHEVLWVPGTDHAGISTQTVVERHLLKTTGKKRTDFSREEFLQHVWQWKNTYEHRILEQLKRVGCSCDWSRLRFTMDAGNNRAVRVMFKKLFEDNLIYRGDYLVNWDPVTQTALADDEVEYEERQSFLWTFRYPLKNGAGHLSIATTRPETLLGDTALAVSPQDPRYHSLVGHMVKLPLTEREIPIVADHRVDPAFGTGVVKVTPAHDPLDYQIGLTHKLPFINIMTPDGKINANGGKFEGMTMEAARQAVVEEMKKLGLVENISPHLHRVGISYRSKAPIEPYMSKQWFIRMEGFGKLLSEVVKSEQVRLIPKHWENVYFHWIDNLRDWCVSRQLWWGHRIPIWYRKKNPAEMICFEGEGAPPEVQAAPDEWVQDEDVLDTWFSSALWPFATLGWPDATPDLKTFYPLSVLVTGHDILFFWVARMLFMGHYAMGKVPFPDVFLHGLIYGKSYWRQSPQGGAVYASPEERHAYDLGNPVPPDVISKWEKMSKSKGNILDPLEIIDQYGTDAMRMALCSSATQAREIDLDRRRFEEFKNFANKVWNGARFVFLHLGADVKLNLPALSAESFSEGLEETLLSLEDRWILSLLNHTTEEVQEHLTLYQFDQAASKAYDFFWKQFCAYYVEIVKPFLYGKTGTAAERTQKQKLLVLLLCQAVRLLHPMTPFITEELFQQLKSRFAGVKQNKDADLYTQETIEALLSPSCSVAPFPRVVRPEDRDPLIEKAFDLIDQVVYTLRNMRGEMKLPPGMATDVYIVGDVHDPKFSLLHDHRHILAALVRTQKIEVCASLPSLGFTSMAPFENFSIVIPLPAEMLAQEIKRLEKEEERLSSSLQKLQTQLANPAFSQKAPPPLLEKQRALLQQTQTELDVVQSKLKTTQRT